MDDEILLAARVLVYSTLTRAYTEEPDALFLGTLTSDSFETAIGLVDSSSSSLLLDKLCEIKEHIESDNWSAMTLHVSQLAEEYNRIFVGPTTLHASPWESIHITGKRALFQPEVLSVREAYKRAGLLPERYQQVSDDYIGLELDFMTKLAQFALERYQADDIASYREWLQQAEEFLQRHLLKWIDSLAIAIKTHYGNCFYALITELTAMYATKDASYIQTLRP
ncbi:TorD/DmsD family molecular chaperone [Adlercreutzia agrestimuris]|uniref:TorD/DmsD family molecular chaperone n=1 Tax=Adlercreutzia agrestimuris TaxID=2941324 RepID=UPI002041492D|nr:molecular chaperone TorD family protein [Adlercreutzia agrestimuris]